MLHCPTFLDTSVLVEIALDADSFSIHAVYRSSMAVIVHPMMAKRVLTGDLRPL